MKDYITKKEYEEMIEEKQKFLSLYKKLMIDSKEIIKQEVKNDKIIYFCIANNKENTYITFYNSDSEDLVQVLLSEKINIFDYLGENLIEEVNVEKPNDDYTYRGFKFKYLEEPYFLSQIFKGRSFEKTELIKEINEEIKYYKEKIIEERQEIYDYTKTNNILNKYKFKIEEEVTNEQIRQSSNNIINNSNFNNNIFNSKYKLQR